MSASRPDGAGDAELASPLGGQHDEGQKDQEDARGDRERPEGREERHERVARRVGVLDGVCLERLDLEPERARDGLEQRDNLGREACSRDVSTAIRHGDELHLAVAVEEPLRLVERHEQDRVGGAGSVEPGDVSHARGDGRPADVNDDPVSGHHAELAGGLRVQVHLARAQVGERQRVPGRPPDRREPVHPGRVPGEEDDARLVLTDVWSLDRDLLDNGPGDAVDEPGSRRRRLDARDGGLADPAGAGRGAERPRDIVGGALRRDRLVGCP